MHVNNKAKIAITEKGGRRDAQTKKIKEGGLVFGANGKKRSPECQVSRLHRERKNVKSRVNKGK